jgi:WD40 repeat protein
MNVGFHPDKGHLFATSENGLVHIWSKPTQTAPGNAEVSRKKNKKQQSKACDGTVRIKDTKTKAVIPILSAVFLSSGQLLLAYGSRLRPTFEPISYTENDSSIVRSLVELERKKKASMLMEQENIRSDAVIG